MSIDRMTEQRISAARALATRAVSPEQIKAVQQQLIESIQSGTLPSYGGVPILEDLTRRLKMVSANQALQQAQAAPQQTIKQQVIDAALQRQQPPQPQPGLDQLPSNLPVEMAAGGIVAFDEGGEVDRYQNRGLVESFLSPTTARMLSTGRSLSPEEEEALARREQGPGLIDRLLSGVTIQGPLGPLRVPLVSPTTREALQTGQAPIPTPAAAATPAAATPAAPRTPGGPTRFERPSLMSLLPSGAPAGGGAGAGAPSVGNISPPNIRMKTPFEFMTDIPPLPDFEGLKRKFDKDEFRRAVNEEAKELEKSQEPLLTAQRQRLEKREQQLEKDAKTAPWLSLTKAGLALAGSNKPFATALSEAAQGGIADLTTAKAAQQALRDKMEERRFQQEQMELNLKSGNRREARENQASLQGLDNQIAQLNTAVTSAQAGAQQARTQTEATLASGAATAVNQGIISMADMNLRSQIANQSARLQSQANSIQAQAAANSYNLGVARLDILERDSQSTNEARRTAARAKQMEVQVKAARLFQENPDEIAFRKSIANKPPKEQERLIEQRRLTFYANVLPQLALEGDSDIPHAPSLINRMMSTNFGRSDFFSAD